MHVYDENKSLVAAGNLDDDVPEADIAPKWDGPFHIQFSAESLDEGASPAEGWYFCFVIGSRKL